MSKDILSSIQQFVKNNEHGLLPNLIKKTTQELKKINNKVEKNKNTPTDFVYKVIKRS